MQRPDSRDRQGLNMTKPGQLDQRPDLYATHCILLFLLFYAASLRLLPLLPPSGL